jgi:hypothetical protein
MTRYLNKWTLILVAFLIGGIAFAVYTRKPPTYYGVPKGYYSPPCIASEMTNTFFQDLSEAPRALAVVHATVVSLLTVQEYYEGKDVSVRDLDDSPYGIVVVDGVIAGNADLTKYRVSAASPRCMKPLHLGESGLLAGQVVRRTTGGPPSFVLALPQRAPQQNNTKSQ